MTDDLEAKAAEALDAYVAARHALSEARHALSDARRAADAAVCALGDAWGVYEAAVKAGREGTR